MKLAKGLTALCTAMFITACSDSTHFITDAGYRAEVEKDFNAKKELMSEGNLFSVFDDQSLTPQEREALEFLYAYMPLGDIADNDGRLFLDAVRTSFMTKEEMPWGKTIPEREFRHFVLPLRVNNEYLDSARTVFYAELKDRVKNLSLEDAVLEVNHWCHEKVVYTPSDARTSSPLATVKTAFGRCGEESTFTVAALRAVGIPARQVYTPRWAHTDDNHAWVEAWVDGKWYFLGACEPEAVLNLAWFNAPASRGMLMHTNVFGKYDGPEEVMRRTNNFTEINVIDNYAPTARIDITVKDESGNPVKDANVEYKIYNYAEFYTVARKTTDEAGKSFLTAGKGDMLVWASKDGVFGYAKAKFGTDKELTITLDRKEGEAKAEIFDIVPPVEGKNLPSVTEEQKEKNAERLHEEDVIREKYISTFMTEEQAKALAKELNTDEAKTVAFIKASRGNWQTISTFLSDAPADKRDLAMTLLGVISEKDLRDVTLDVLNDHLNNTPEVKTDMFATCILNPRVEYEQLTPYKSYFQANIAKEDMEKFKEDPQSLVNWIKEKITICNEWNMVNTPVTPEGVWKSKLADARSRDILFVSIARSIGIPAWKDPITGKIQYQNLKEKDNAAKGIYDVDFESGVQNVAPTGKLKLNYVPSERLKDPKYYIHFTISKIVGGSPVLLSYDSGDTDMGEGATWSNKFKKGITLDTGYYMLVTGTRLANGSVLSEVTFFNIKEGETTALELKLREDDTAVQVIGNFNSESLYTPVNGDKPVSVLSTTGRGYYVVAVLGAKEEPTNHFLKDLAKVAPQFEKWGRQMVFLFPSEKNWNNFDITEFEGLPSNITWGIDNNKAIHNSIIEDMKMDKAGSLPLIIIADTFNRIVFVSQGYNIGTAERMLDVIHKL